MTDEDRGPFADDPTRALMERLGRDLPYASLRVGRVVTAGNRPTVTIDGSSAPLPCRVAGLVPGPGQGCLVAFHGGTGWVLGPLGAPTKLGRALMVTDSGSITTETALALSVETVIPAPGLSVRIGARARVRSATANARAALTVRRGPLVTDPLVDADLANGTVAVTGSGNGPILTGYVIDENPDPGPTTYTVCLRGSAAVVAEGTVSTARMDVTVEGAMPADTGA